MENYVGKRLDGRYEIRDVVGVGGMAVVYKAYDNIDDRIVAVKILKDEYLTNEEFRRRFKNESKAIAVLSHRNIVKVFDVSFGDRLQYIVMEYIEGITLKEYIEERGIIDWNEALFFSIQILRALQHAHDKGIVHRDVKPQNIMLLENGTIKVTDFGIARFSHGETRTMTEKAIGSVHYISPEQAKGEMTDEKADLYSVGVVLYEMLTGKLPFEAESAVSVALMQVNNEAALPRTINSRIPMGFEQITMKAMQKNTRDRYQSASEILMDLEELKRNPNIKFDYQKYSADDQATRYVGKIQGSTRVSDTPPVKRQPERAKIVPPVPDARRKLDNARINEELDAIDNGRGVDKKTIGIIAGVGIALVIFVVAVVFNMLKNDSFILGVNKKVEVPNFIGMNYEEEIAGNPEYKGVFNFEVRYENSTEGEPGCVYRQDPESGIMKPSNSTILLYVVKTGEAVTIPDVSGQDYRTARAQLESLGFTVTAVGEENDGGKANTVLRTSPAAGQSAEQGASVTIYYAKKANDTVKAFKMPSLTGKTLDQVKKILEDKGLVLGSVDEKDSTKPKNTVIEQSPLKGVPVKEGDTVDLVVSTGRSVVEKTIKLPSNVGTVSIRVLVDGSTAVSDSVDTNTEKNFTFVVGGDRANTPVKVYIGESLYYDAIGDFSVSPAKLSKEKYYTISFYVDVVGMSKEEAIKKLNAAGYNNITIKNEPSYEQEGRVIAQTPMHSSAPNLDSSTTIVLTVASPMKPTTTGATTTAPTTQNSTDASSTDASETEV